MSLSYYKDMLKFHRLSVTPVRIAVLKALDANPHIDADKIFNFVKNEIATTSKQAVYNNLHTLVESGLIREIKPKGLSALYETRVDDNHHHLVCKKCQLVMDTNCYGAAPCLEPMHPHGFIIDEAEVIFWGLCPSCQSNQKTDQKEKKHG